ncbi:MAG TPA: PH domain-containing protein [Micromonosporaceae bacterium]|nr:PH domain-containing protein [Micromonosporaceae bacterium]
MTPRVRIRPRRVRVVAWVAAVAVVVVSAAVATGLRGSTGAGTAVFQPGDQIAMIGLGLVGAAAILAFTRPLVEADSERIRIRNIVGGYELPWQVVRAVRFEHGASWATLELADDDVVSVLAVQRADKEHAVRAVRALRTLLEESRATPAVPADGD